MRSRKGFRKANIGGPKQQTAKIPGGGGILPKSMPSATNVRGARNITGKMVSTGKVPKVKKVSSKKFKMGY